MQTVTRCSLAMLVAFGVVPGPHTSAQSAAGSPFGTAVRLDEDWSVSVTPVSAAEWLARYPTALQGANGALVGFTVRFAGKGADALSLAINYSDAARSDLTVTCAGQAINPFKASSHSRGRTPEFSQLGGIRLPDGRTFAVLTGPEVLLTVFFDVPPECASGTPSLSLAFELADWDEARRVHSSRRRHTLRFTSGRPNGP